MQGQLESMGFAPVPRLGPLDFQEIRQGLQVA